MLSNDLAVEINEYLCLLAHHPLTLILSEQLSTVLTPIDLRAYITLPLIHIRRLGSLDLLHLLKATLYQSLKLFHEQFAC